MGSAKCILLQSQTIQLLSRAAELLLLLGPSWLSPCPAPCRLSPFLAQPWAPQGTQEAGEGTG